MRGSQSQAPAAGCCCIVAALLVALLQLTRTLPHGSMFGAECTVAEGVELRSLSRTCGAQKGMSSSSSSKREFGSSHISRSSAKGSCRLSFAVAGSSVSPWSLCARIASRLASARIRFALIVAACSSVSLCACAAAVRCLPRRVPACFCHPVHPSAPRARSSTSACACSRLCSNVFRHFATWFFWLLGSSVFQRASAANASSAFLPSRPSRP